MLKIDPRLLTVRKTEDGDYQVNTPWVKTSWRNGDDACREYLHGLLARAGYKRIRPEDDDPIAGDYRKY